MADASSTDQLSKVLKGVSKEGVGSDREQLLLWLIRNQYGFSEADSYEFVLDPADDLFQGVQADGALVSRGRDVVASVYLKLGDVGTLRKWVKDITSEFAARRSPERDLSTLSPRLRSIFEPALASEVSEIVRVVVCVSREQLTLTERRRIARASQDESTAVEIVDLSFLRALASAELEGPSGVPQVRIEVPKSHTLELRVGSARGVVLSVQAVDVAKWPGIDDRTLFDLNVRHALGVNRVRRSLERALVDPDAAEEFIAYHNGLTAVCRKFTLDDDGIAVEGLSVVDGAQTVVAIHDKADAIRPEVRLLLKLIEAAPDSNLSRNIAIRSNTQNPVTSRNLRALDPIQARFVRDVSRLGYTYIVRPDQGAPTNARVIRNDDVAQLICSIYVRRPALAVKRQVLFEYPQYQEIFPESLSAARVVFAHITRQAVEAAKRSVPAVYRSAWALTSLTVVYMASEAMRADPVFSKILEEPSDAVRMAEQLRRDIAPFVSAACKALEERRKEFESSENDDSDDFKVAFKQTRTLAELGMTAARIHRRVSRAGL